MRVSRRGQLFAKGAGKGQMHAPTTMLPLQLDGRRVVLVADSLNQRVVAVGEDGAWLRSVGSEGSGDGQFCGPYGIAQLQSGEVAVSDEGNQRLVVLSGADLSFARAVPLGFKVRGVATDSRTGRVFVSDSQSHAVHEVEVRKGRSLRRVGGGGRGTGDGEFNLPCGLAVDSPRRRLFVGDFRNQAVAVLSIADGGLRWVKRISVGFKVWMPFVHPESGAVVVCDGGIGKSGKLVMMDVNEDAESAHVLQVKGSVGQVKSLCWVESSKLLWAAQWDPDCVQRLRVVGSQ